MADEQTTESETPRKGAKIPVIIGLLLAVIGGGGGFYAVQSGLVFASESHGAEAAHAGADAQAGDHHRYGEMPDVAYVPVEPLVISLGNGATGKHLRFRVELEVAPDHRAEVERLLPRVSDVLNSYLRALDVADLTDRASLMRLRAQMLRRLQVVAGGGRINDLLIMEFVLN